MCENVSASMRQDHVLVDLHVKNNHQMSHYHDLSVFMVSKPVYKYSAPVGVYLQPWCVWSETMIAAVFVLGALVGKTYIIADIC